MTFDRTLKFIMKWEGGEKITRDPIDPGGTTKFGISQRAYPSLNIEELTHEQAAEIYRKDYWLKGRCDQLPDPVNIAHMDACVNCGVVQAAKFLQRAVGIDDAAAHASGLIRHAAGIKDDGIIGIETLAAIALTDPKDLARNAIIEREKYYHKLIASRPALKRFQNGWMNRTSDLKKECL